MPTIISSVTPALERIQHIIMTVVRPIDLAPMQVIVEWV